MWCVCPPNTDTPLPTSPVPPSSSCQHRDTPKMGTPQNAHHIHQESDRAGHPLQYLPPPGRGVNPKAGLKGCQVYGAGCISGCPPPEAELPLGLGGPC